MFGVLKFAAGLAAGLVLGCLLAALAAPAAGEETRQRLRAILPGGDSAREDDRASVGTSARSARAGGPLEALQARFRHAFDEAKKTRQIREQELRAELTARRTGSAP